MCLQLGPNSQLDYADGMKADLSPAAGLVVSFQTVPLGLEFAGFRFRGAEQHSRRSRQQAGIITGCRQEQPPRWEVPELLSERQGQPRALERELVLAS